MRRSSTSITLVLISSALAAIGFEGCRRKLAASNNPDAYFSENGPASTQPYSRNDPYYNHNSYHHYGSGFWGGSSSSSSSGGGSSSSSSHTSRGGFGSSGHSASS